MKKTTLVFIILVSVLCVSVVVFMTLLPTINRVNSCKDTLVDAEKNVSAGELESAIFKYEYYSDKCISDRKISKYLADPKGVLQRLDEVRLYHDVVDLYQSGDYAYAEKAAGELFKRFPDSGFKGETEKLLIQISNEKEQAYQEKYYVSDTESIARQYKALCSAVYPLDQDMMAAVQNSPLPAKYWIERVEVLDSSMLAASPAEFKVAVCFKEKDPVVLETCEYNATGIKEQGADHTLQRRTLKFTAVLLDAGTGLEFAAYPDDIKGTTPDPCPETLTTDSSLSSLTTFVEESDPILPAGFEDWLKEQLTSR